MHIHIAIDVKKKYLFRSMVAYQTDCNCTVLLTGTYDTSTDHHHTPTRTFAVKYAIQFILITRRLRLK